MASQRGTGTSKEGQQNHSSTSALLKRSLAADSSSRQSTDESSNQHASSGGGGHSGSSSMQYQQDSIGHTQGSNRSPGTFGRQTSRNGSIHSQSNENLPSPILDGTAYRRETDSATPIAGMFTNPSVKGKQRAKDDSNSRTSIDSSRRSSVRWSGELPRLDEDLDDELFSSAVRNKYQTPLSPRIQATTSIANSIDQERKRRSFEISPRLGIAKQSNPSLGQIRDLSPDSELAMTGSSSRGKGYRRFEREVESQQEKLRLEGGGTLSPVSSSASPPLFALGDGRMQAESSNAQAKRAKRVSLGQVSIDGVPVAIGSPIYGHGSSPTRQIQTDSRNSKLSPNQSRSRTRSSYGHRRMALSESSRSGSKETRKIRKRTSSDPIVKSEDPEFMTDRRRSEDGRRIFRGLLEGGRARRRSETEGISAVSQITLAPSTAGGQKKAFSEEYLAPFTSQSSTRLPIGTNAESGVALARNSSSVMRWDSAHATALSLRQGDHYGYDLNQNESIGGGRISTNSTLMHNRNLARYHLGALISLRSRIPHHTSKSLEPIQFRSIIARIHHSLLIFQIYLHVPATIFFDYNALYTLVQVALYPDTNNQSAAWWIASGIYAGCFAFWLIVVLVIWEIVIQFKRRWINDRPFALPIYLSSHAFNLSSVRSFSLYSLLYRTRLQASKRDFLIETFWFFSQNWPTVLTILPRGIILTILLVIYNPTSNEGNRIPLNGQMRDPVYFNSSTGLLTSFSYVVILVNTAWIAWRVVLLCASWIGLLFAVGPKSLINRERSAYKDEEAEISLTDFRLSTSTRPLLNISRASNIRDIESRQEIHHHGELPIQDEMRQVSNLHPVERQSRKVTRENLGSVEIPRRSHSLMRGTERPIEMKQTAIEQSNKEPKLETLLRQKTTLPPWAWRARAEERLSTLIFECRLDDEIATPEEEINAWGDPLPNHIGGQEGAKDQRMTAYGPQNVYESRMAAVPILFLPEDDSNVNAITPTHLSNLEGTYASTSDQLAARNNVAKAGLGQEHADKSVSSVDIGRSDAYPFPSQSEEKSLQPIPVLNQIKASDSPLVVPTAIPFESSNSPSASISSGAQNVNPDIKRQPNTNPYISSQTARSSSSKKSLNGKTGVHSSSNSTSSLVESIRTALGRKSTETTSGTENARNEAIRSQTNLQTSPKNSVAAAPSWWKGIFGGASSSAPEVGVSDATGVAETGVQSDDQIVETMNDTVVHPRTSSPLSGIRTVGQRNNDEDLLGVTHSAETSNTTTSNVDDSGEIANQIIRHAQRNRSNDDDDATSLRSTSTDDSEERRIWSQFPEQSRRHPPGLIALELEQRKLAAEKRLRNPVNLSSQSGSQRTIVAPIKSTVDTSDNVSLPAIQNTSEQANTSSFEDDSSFGSTTHMLPSSQLEALGPIQEESWSNSHEAITDEEMELMHSEQNSALRR